MSSKEIAIRTGISRRDFLVGHRLLRAGLALLSRWSSAEDAQAATGDNVNVGFIGVGTQGRVLLTNSASRFRACRFTAVCDIWPYHQDYAVKPPQEVQPGAERYTDYQEMLDKEKDLDAVIVATPDWMHRRAPSPA